MRHRDSRCWTVGFVCLLAACAGSSSKNTRGEPDGGATDSGAAGGAGVGQAGMAGMPAAGAAGMGQAGSAGQAGTGQAGAAGAAGTAGSAGAAGSPDATMCLVVRGQLEAGDDLQAVYAVGLDGATRTKLIDRVGGSGILLQNPAGDRLTYVDGTRVMSQPITGGAPDVLDAFSPDSPSIEQMPNGDKVLVRRIIAGQTRFSFVDPDASPVIVFDGVSDDLFAISSASSPFENQAAVIGDIGNDGQSDLARFDDQGLLESTTVDSGFGTLAFCPPNGTARGHVVVRGPFRSATPEVGVFDGSTITRISGGMPVDNSGALFCTGTHVIWPGGGDLFASDVGNPSPVDIAGPNSVSTSPGDVIVFRRGGSNRVGFLDSSDDFFQVDLDGSNLMQSGPSGVDRIFHFPGDGGDDLLLGTSAGAGPEQLFDLTGGIDPPPLFPASGPNQGIGDVVPIGSPPKVGVPVFQGDPFNPTANGLYIGDSMNGFSSAPLPPGFLSTMSMGPPVASGYDGGLLAINGITEPSAGPTTSSSLSLLTDACGSPTAIEISNDSSTTGDPLRARPVGFCMIPPPP